MRRKEVKRVRIVTDGRKNSLLFNPLPTSLSQPPLHSRIMSACSAPIVSFSAPVTYTSMLPSTPREATSSSATSPTTPTLPALKDSSRANLPSYQEFGLIHYGQCQLPKEYLHTLWACGIVSGWTCHCNIPPTTTNPLTSPLAHTVKDAQGLGHDAG